MEGETIQRRETNSVSRFSTFRIVWKLKRALNFVIFVTLINMWNPQSCIKICIPMLNLNMHACYIVYIKFQIN